MHTNDGVSKSFLLYEKHYSTANFDPRAVIIPARHEEVDPRGFVAIQNSEPNGIGNLP